jgi:hypothetical protein
MISIVSFRMRLNISRSPYVLPVKGAGEVEPDDPVDDLLLVIQSNPDTDSMFRRPRSERSETRNDRPVESTSPGPGDGTFVEARIYPL